METRPKQGNTWKRREKKDANYVEERRKKEEDKKCEITGGPKDMGKVLNETAEGLTELKVIIEKRRVNDNKYSKEAKAQSCNSF